MQQFPRKQQRLMNLIRAQFLSSLENQIAKVLSFRSRSAFIFLF